MLENLGLFGLFLACLLSATIVPFSSEIILSGALMSGYNAWIVVLVASLGNTAGGMISFLMGWLCKWDWLERWFRVNREKLEKMRAKVTRYGYPAALLAWLPFVGDLISIAMGLLRMNPWLTALLMFAGKLARYVIVAGLVSLV